MVSPLVTIGLTCYNAVDTIERAVKSALAQDWPALQVLVADDCSTDGSWELLQCLAEVEPRLLIFRHEQNRGYPGALNTIIANAHGDFFAIFDDDDDNVPDRIRAQFERVTNYERDTGAHLVFCYSNRNVVKYGQSKVDHVSRAIGRARPEPHGNAVADYVLGIGKDRAFVWGLFGSCTLMARRSTFLAVGQFDESFRRCAEWDMAVRGAFLGGHFIAVDRPLITQYKTAGTDKGGTTSLKYALLLRDKHREYLGKRGLYWASRARARANFYDNGRNFWRSQFHMAATYALSPRRLLSLLMDWQDTGRSSRR